MANVHIPEGYGAASVQIKHSAMARPSFVTFGVLLASPAPAGGYAAAVGKLFTDATSQVKGQMDFDCTLGPTTLRIGHHPAEPTIEIDPTTAAGGVSVNMLPPNCALLVHKRTALGGRKNQGRMFVPWIVQEAKCDEGGRITAPGDIAVLQAAFTDLLAKSVAGGVSMVLLHGGLTVVPPVGQVPLPTLITSLQVDPLVATQRRRLGR